MATGDSNSSGAAQTGVQTWKWGSAVGANVPVPDASPRALTMAEWTRVSSSLPSAWQPGRVGYWSDCGRAVKRLEKLVLTLSQSLPAS